MTAPNIALRELGPGALLPYPLEGTVATSFEADMLYAAVSFMNVMGESGELGRPFSELPRFAELVAQERLGPDFADRMAPSVLGPFETVPESRLVSFWFSYNDDGVTVDLHLCTHIGFISNGERTAGTADRTFRFDSRPTPFQLVNRAVTSVAIDEFVPCPDHAEVVSQ